MDLCMAARHFLQLWLDLGASLLLSQDLCLSHSCSARPLGRQIISEQLPANKSESHINCDQEHGIFIFS